MKLGGKLHQIIASLDVTASGLQGFVLSSWEAFFNAELT